MRPAEAARAIADLILTWTTANGQPLALGPEACAAIGAVIEEVEPGPYHDEATCHVCASNRRKEEADAAL